MVEKTETSSQEYIILKTGMNGNKGWEIKVCGDNNDEVMEKIEEVENILKEKYGGDTK